MELIFVIILMLVILFIINWLSEKYNGVTIVSNTDQRNEVNVKNNNYLKRLERLQQTDPENVLKAIELCEKKAYALTASNILVEYQNILSGNTSTIFEKTGKSAAKGVVKVKEMIKTIDFDKNSLSHKIKELNHLKEMGLISEEEYNQKKNDLIHKF